MHFIGTFLFTFLFCSSALAARVAVLAPQSGDGAMFGKELVEGVKIAVDVINEAGGLLGEKVELMNVDDLCEESASVKETQMMSLASKQGEDKINLVIGPYCNDGFKEVSDIAAKNKILRIVPQALSRELYDYNATGLYKIGGKISDQAKSFFEFYKDKWIDKSLAVVYDSEDVAFYEVASELQNLMLQNDLANRITLYDFAAYKKYKKMAKEILLNNKVVYILGNKRKIANLAQHLQEEDENITIVVDSYMAVEYFFKEMGNFAEGIYFLRLNNQKSNAEFTKELVKLRIKNREPYGMGVFGYTAVMLWHDMVKKAKSFDAAIIDKSVEHNYWQLPWGKIKFQQGKAEKTGGWSIYLLQEGDYAQVY